jgi:hypothetical protein
MRLSINGSATFHESFFVYVLYKTNPNERAMSMYKTVHTGPKIQEGGAHVGFSNV